MSRTCFKPIADVYNLLSINDGFDTLRSMEENIYHYAIGPDLENRKIFVSQHTMDKIKKLQLQDCYVNNDDLCIMDKILDTDFATGSYEEKVIIFKKSNNEYIKYITTEILVTKASDTKSGDIIGWIRVTEDDDCYLSETRARQSLHDLKNQLMSVTTVASRIGNTTSNKQIKELSYNIKDLVNNCNYLINHACGKTQSKFNREADMHRVMDTHISILEMEDNITVHTHLDAQNAMIRGNCYGISNALQNIILNAVQAIEHKGNITIKTQNVMKSPYQNAKERQYLEISITDDGIGIDEDIINKIFDNSFTTKDYGSGLGLYTTKQTIKCHNGTVSVASKKGEGTTFTIHIPNIK